MSSAADRLAISRLVHRFGFGPKPGQYLQLLAMGVDAARQQLVAKPVSDPTVAAQIPAGITDLGPYPLPTSPTKAAFIRNLVQQWNTLAFWWLDKMVVSDAALSERMTWFWHGHWATSSVKVEYSLPMYLQNQTLRTYALGNFKDMSRAMITDGALLYWLDGQLNKDTSPNENLGREFMELFTLGVGNYSEDDVKAAAQALTGYSLVRSNSTVSFNPNRHVNTPITLLGVTQPLTAQSLSDFVTSQSANLSFIPKRVWYRFMSTSKPVPNAVTAAFGGHDIFALIAALASDPSMTDPTLSQVRSPVEWFVAVCRALNVVPSKIPSSATILSTLSYMGQLPFAPPNVGGWPADEAWLTAASVDYRVGLAKLIIGAGDLSPLQGTANPVQACADLLGVAQWTPRTAAILAQASANLSEMLLLAVCSPDYVVNQ